jgi:hypothetical protein
VRVTSMHASADIDALSKSRAPTFVCDGKFQGVPMPESRYHDEIPSNYVCSPIGDTLVLLFDVHAR